MIFRLKNSMLYFLAVSLSSLSTAVHSTTTDVHNVHVSMTANFDSVPLIFEIAEFFDDHYASKKDGNKLYFAFMHQFIHYYYTSSSSSPPSQRDIYDWTVNAFRDEIGDAGIETLEFALSLNHYTPRLAMFEQLYASYLSSSSSPSQDDSRAELVVLESARATANRNDAVVIIRVTDDGASIAQIEHTLSSSKSSSLLHGLQMSDFGVFESHDHWHGDACLNLSRAHSIVTYYGDYMSSTFEPMFRLLTRAADAGEICLVLRPIALRKADKAFNLQGFGVELAIKNMEYLVMDDRNSNKNSDAAVQVQLNADGGVVQPQAAAADEGVQAEWRSFLRDMETPNATKLLEMEEEPMKAYLTRLDVQVTKALLAAYEYVQQRSPSESGSGEGKEKNMNQIKRNNAHFLSMFRSLSTDFPLYLDDVAHLASDSFSYLFPYLQTMQRYQREGQQSFALNGINVGGDEFDVYYFYDILRKESKFVDYLQSVMRAFDASFQNNRLISKLLATPFTIGAAAKSAKAGAGAGGMMGMFGMGGGSGLDEEDVRIDMRDIAFAKQYRATLDVSPAATTSTQRAVAWMNNIERDAKYNSFYKDLRPLQSFMVMQQIVPIKKNMYNGVAIFDPMDVSAYVVFDALYDAVQQGIPLRLGFILYPRDLHALQFMGERATPQQRISQRIVQCVTFLMNNTASGRQAALFLSNLYKPVLETFQEQSQAEEMEQNQMKKAHELVVTLQRIEATILDFIVDEDKQSILDTIYALDVTPYLKLTKSFLDNKGLTSLLQAAAENGDDVHGSGCLLAVNGRIFPHIAAGGFNVYSLVSILMEEQREYLMSFATGKLSKKTNFNNFVYERSDVLARFSKFLSWLGNAGAANAIETSDDAARAVSNTAITVLQPQQLKHANAAVKHDQYWATIYTNTADAAATHAYTMTVWLVVNPSSMLGRQLLSSFAHINSQFETFGESAQKETEDPSSHQPQQLPFGIRFAVVFNDENQQVPKQCASLAKQTFVDADGTFMWHKFQESATDCAAVSSEDLDLVTQGDIDGHEGMQTFFWHTLGLSKNENFIVLNGQVLPLQHLVNETEISASSQTSNVATLATHDLWTLLERYHEEISPIMRTLLNEVDGLDASDASGHTQLQRAAALHDTMMAVVNTLYYRRLHEGFRATPSVFTVADTDEELRSALDSVSVYLSQNDDVAFMAVDVVLDPLNPHTQRTICLLDELYKYHSLFDIRIVFNPVSAMANEINRYGLPNKLSRYYRYVLHPNHYVQNAQDDESIAADKAVFENMPRDVVLTMGITDTPGTWLYESLECKYDLDNLLLSRADEAVLSVNYHLTSLLIQGQCFDEKLQPVPGLQLQLTPQMNAQSVVDATIAMQTLGYWQLKANPGVWSVQLREGRTTEVMLVDTNRTQSSDAIVTAKEHEQGVNINLVLNTFRSAPFRLRVQHRPGMESEELLPQLTEEQIEAQEQRRLQEKQGGQAGGAQDEKKESESFLGKLKKSIFGSDETAETESEIKAKTVEKAKEKKDAFEAFFGANEKYLTPTPQRRVDAKPDDETTIHVMSVASGHLYERFLKIMMITVLRNTNAKHVKFWFLKQFLSPRFREFIPHFERAYDCSIELVEYRWPEWLRKQTVKQRIIWAYKILFLDVLFPLDLERIIFVDADQVVRADLLELWNLDLQGKPYAYTPFGDTNAETEGFRFWKQGYWSNHLRGKPYHISALYVVDLNTFRRLRAGDSLRVLYEQLSADPNSLANLDQDLPNFAQHMVPIYSLPPEWLWCETWCAMDELDNAKSIDLCNNPMTKEPKIDKAKRMIPEWIAVDDEATDFEHKLIEQGLISV